MYGSPVILCGVVGLLTLVALGGWRAWHRGHPPAWERRLRQEYWEELERRAEGGHAGTHAAD